MLLSVVNNALNATNSPTSPLVLLFGDEAGRCIDWHDRRVDDIHEVGILTYQLIKAPASVIRKSMPTNHRVIAEVTNTIVK